MTPPDDKNLAVIAHRLGAIDEKLTTVEKRLEPLVIEREVERQRIAAMVQRMEAQEAQSRKTAERIDRMERRWIAVAGVSAGVGGGTATGILGLVWKLFNPGGA